MSNGLITSTSNIFELTKPGIDIIINDYKHEDAVFKRIFKSKKADKRTMVAQEIQDLMPASIKKEGMVINSDTMQALSQKLFTCATYGLKTSITQEAEDDDLYGIAARKVAMLKRSLAMLKNQLAAAVFTLGTTTELSIDGKPFFSTQHPVGNGEVQSNFINMELTQTALQTGLNRIRRFKAVNGDTIDVKAKGLYISVENQIPAATLLGSQFIASIGTTNGNAYSGVNDINVINHDKMLPGGYIVDQNITSPTFSVMLTDLENGLMHYQRKEPSHSSWYDHANMISNCMMTERYIFGVADWRAAVCLST